MMVSTLGPAVGFYKIGLELAYVGGIDLARRLIDAGNDVFLDLKLHDIPNTVARATAQIAGIGARFLTVHAFGQTMTAALEGVRGTPLQVLGVTVLTSANAEDVAEDGYALAPAALVGRRAVRAQALGLPGLVLSPLELEATRRLVGRDMLLVTPGVRPAGSMAGDQKRITTPGDAIRAGADHLVVGRPITAASDPRGAAEAILAEIGSAR